MSYQCIRVTRTFALVFKTSGFYSREGVYITGGERLKAEFLRFEAGVQGWRFEAGIQGGSRPGGFIWRRNV
jgi:hypothetical protein